jgi:predicted amidohydrolase YtcJ
VLTVEKEGFKKYEQKNLQLLVNVPTTVNVSLQVGSLTTQIEVSEACTMGSAYAEFQEKEKGSITTGKLADMVLLSDDIFAIAPAKIREVRLLKTFVGGRLVFDAAAAGHQ